MRLFLFTGPYLSGVVAGADAAAKTESMPREDLAKTVGVLAAIAAIAAILLILTLFSGGRQMPP